MFTAVVDCVLARLPDAEAGLERTRLLGSSAAAGLGEAVLRPAEFCRSAKSGTDGSRGRSAHASEAIGARQLDERSRVDHP